MSDVREVLDAWDLIQDHAKLDLRNITSDEEFHALADAVETLENALATLPGPSSDVREELKQLFHEGGLDDALGRTWTADYFVDRILALLPGRKAQEPYGFVNPDTNVFRKSLAGLSVMSMRRYTPVIEHRRLATPTPEPDRWLGG